VPGPVRILLVEDSPSDARLLQQDLSQIMGDAFDVTWVDRLDDAIAKLNDRPFDVGLLDLTLPDSMGAATIDRVHKAAPGLPIVVLTGLDDEAAGVDAIRKGVQDYLVKGMVDGKTIARAIRYAIERKQTQEELYRANTLLAQRVAEIQAANKSLLESRKAALNLMEDALESRKRAEDAVDALRETKDYLDKLIQHANAPIVVWDPELHITRFNRGFEKLTGCMEIELLGESISLLFPEESCDASLQKIETALKGAQLELVEIPILCKNGDIKIVLWNSANIYARDGLTIAATIVHGTDITERKQMEAELAEKRRLLENLVRKQGKVIIDTKENLDLETRERLRVEQELTHRQQALEAVYAMATAFNTSFTAMNDQVVLNVAKILDTPFAVIYYFMEDKVSIGSLFCKGELVRHHESMIPCALCRPDIFNINTSGGVNVLKQPHHAACFPKEEIRSYIGVPVLDHQGKVYGMICAFDSTERSFDEYEVRLVEIFARYLSHEQSQRELESQLARANEMKILGQLTSGVAHEVRNPLNGITAIVGALSKELGDAERFQPYVQHLRNQVTRLTMLMEDLLALGRPVREENKLELPVVALVENALSSWQHGLEKPREVRLELPQTAQQNFMVRVEGARIEQIIINLLENAHQHSPPDQTIIISIDTSLPAMVLISVRDNGPGIANEIMPRIFEPFFTTRKSGTGLGLSIVKHIVESHGGSITAQNNREGSGVTLTISLPLSRTAV
jgi:PAS domain S-box-containing protein